eukprot:TRINITY_DN730_c0_g1_i1.p1 TRINITY_DN730_c0_g1~~TRINITY_DN730_c0_g1_i1.p1  ORF type:complete len:766 (-),score=207.58 TRINITY_DN730_c0_g1_i1:448-2745(-)
MEDYINTIRANGQLDHYKRIVHLDHAAATVYTKDQLLECNNKLLECAFGNPHSQNEVGHNTSREINQMRQRVLEFVNANPNEYSVIFTSGATASLRIVGESFPWTDDSIFGYTRQNHNSVIGIRGILPSEKLKQFSVESVNDGSLDMSIMFPESGKHLLAIPGECNFSGKKINLQKLEELKSQRKNVYCLIDTAKLVSTSKLDLSKLPNLVDFCSISFYKIFGYPCGVGALIIRSSLLPLLNKKYFGGGTVGMVVTSANRSEVQFRPGVERFEDGTLPFTSIIQLGPGFDQIEKVGGMVEIQKHTHGLMRSCLDKLSALKHSNGSSVCRLYSSVDTSAPIEETMEQHGSIIAFSLLAADGTIVGHSQVERLAGMRNIQMRTGCFCNPGACAEAAGLSDDELVRNAAEGHVCWDSMDVLHGKATGACRISFGYSSTNKDIDAFIDFVEEYFVEKEMSVASETTINAEEMKTTPDGPILEDIVLFPIKSCGGVHTKKWALSSSGHLLFDREWMLVDASTGRSLTQKQIPAMCLLQPSIDLKTMIMNVSYPESGSIDIPLIDESLNAVCDDPEICGNKRPSNDCGDEASRFFSSILGRPCYLVRSSKNKNSSTKKNTATKRRGQKTEQKNFANSAQFLLSSVESILDLEKRVRERGSDAPVSIDAFRPNLVVRCNPYKEDTWKTVQIGDIALVNDGNCSRCQMVNVNPTNGERYPEPLLTLAKYRKKDREIIMGQFFGIREVPESSPVRWLNCGPLQVLETQETEVPF